MEQADQNITRRALVRKAGLTAAGAVLGATALPTGSCAALLAEWERLNALPFRTEQENNATSDRMAEIEHAMAATPATTLPDLRAKARLLAHCENNGLVLVGGEMTIGESLADDLDRFVGGAQ